MKIHLFFFSVPLCFLVSCSQPQEINTDDLDKTCRVNGDCTLVFVGDACDLSCEGAAAISQAGGSAYEDRHAAARSECDFISENQVSSVSCFIDVICRDCACTVVEIDDRESEGDGTCEQ